MSTYKAAPDDQKVVYLTLPDGESIPLLVDEQGVPSHIISKWMWERRDGVRQSTLEADFGALRHIYNGFRAQKLDFDLFLSSGNTLTNQQLQSLIAYLKRVTTRNSLVSPSNFNHYLQTTEQILCWSYENHVTNNMQLRDELNRVKRFIKRKKLSVKSIPIKPLTDEEIAKIRPVFKYLRHGFRDRLLFEMSKATGARRGELLSIKLEHIHIDDNYVEIRQNNDKTDKRHPRPRVKTEERDLAVPPRLMSHIQEYIENHRIKGSNSFLFMAQGGKPLSIGGTDSIIKKVSKLSGVDLSWHRMRHTFGNSLFTYLKGNENRGKLMMKALGHANEKSQDVYIAHALNIETNEILAKRNNQLYEDFSL